MKQAKDATEFLRPLVPFATTLWAVAEPGQHDARPVEAIVEASGGVARPGPHVADALRALPRDRPARVLICGSLYLAGEVLKLDAMMGFAALNPSLTNVRSASLSRALSTDGLSRQR